jgi:hypothetical protein
LVVYVPLSYLYEKTLGSNSVFHSHLQAFPPPIPADLHTDEDTVTIVFLGGSTTAWAGWTDMVQQEHSERFPNKKIRTLNQGVPWYTTLHSLKNRRILQGLVLCKRLRSH